MSLRFARLRASIVAALLLVALSVVAAASEFIPPDILQRELTTRMTRIEELQALREWGIQNKIRVWCAGGSATGLAVYVKQDLENEALKKAGKSPKYFEGRFSYNYFDVFRSTQDADIVIDGSEADARKLEEFLHSRYKYLQGSKQIWEVRLLRHSRGSGDTEKFPLLEFDFQNQNSDSFSTGMIEVTEPPPGENRIRDLFDWKNQKLPRFLRDLAEGKVSFFRNPNHLKTKFALSGANPEIQSAIRALTKAFQYEAELRPEAEAEIRKIIDDWDPTASLGRKAENDIAKNGQKLFWHSPDVERAWDLLESLGLRQKLVQFGKLHGKKDLATWLDREPLRMKPVGTTGRTAAELKITVVAHETNSFLAYESISRSRDGKPNVFISRDGFEGEAAVYGDGFYTRIGEEGARNTGLTVRFRMRGDAREGTDFVVKNGDYVVVKNAAVLEVIDESLNLTPIEYFRLLDHEFDASDLGMYEKLRLKLKIATAAFTPDEEKEVVAMVEARLKQLAKAKRPAVSPLIQEWMKSAIPKSDEILTRMKAIFDYTNDRLPWDLAAGGRPEWWAADANAVFFLNQKRMVTHPKYGEWFEEAMAKVPDLMIREVLSQPTISGHPKYTEWMTEVLTHRARTAIYLLYTPAAIRNPRFVEWVDQALARKEIAIASYVLPAPGVADFPEFSRWVERSIEISSEAVARWVFTMPEISRHPKFPEWVDRVLADKAHYISYFATEKMRTHPLFSKWMNFAAEKAGSTIGHSMLWYPEYMALPNYGEWVERALRHDPKYITYLLLSKPKLFAMPDFGRWMDYAIERAPGAVAKNVLTVPELMDHPRYAEWVLATLKKTTFAGLDKPLALFMATGKGESLRAICGARKVTTLCLRAGLLKGKVRERCLRLFSRSES